jgi:SPP1 gp7 family putative phage head morphogenesis protein
MSQVNPFGVQFSEAIAFLKGKLPEASGRWNDLAGPVHAKVFTVAGATSAAMAGELQASLVKALEEGMTISQFRKDFDQVVQRHGWTYNGKRGWRSALIFNANMRSATMAGRWAQIQQNKANRPYLGYRTAGDARVRPLHRLWDGILRHVDDPFWATHYPPNGWGCRCTVRAYALWEIQEKGLYVQTTPYKIVYRDVANKDGLIDRVPVGIDPGWDHNVGQSWIDPELALGAKLATLPAALRGPMVDKTISPAFQQAISERFKAFRTGVKEVGNTGKAHIVGFLDSAVLDSVATQVPEVPLRTSAIAAIDEAVPALESGAWSAAMLDELPVHLRNYQAVLWDSQAGALVVVPQGRYDLAALPVVTLAPNTRTRFGHVLAVQQLATMGSTELLGTRFRRLVGRVPE